jgi:hypothetical protein
MCGIVQVIAHPVDQAPHDRSDDQQEHEGKNEHGAFFPASTVPRLS